MAVQQHLQLASAIQAGQRRFLRNAKGSVRTERFLRTELLNNLLENLRIKSRLAEF